MLRQEELAFVKAISTMQLSPAILKELRMTLSRRKKKSQWCLQGFAAPHLQVGKGKANELVSLGDSSEPANRLTATGAGSAPLHAVTGQHAASCSRHLVPLRREGRCTQLSRLGPSPLFSHVGRSRPQPWIILIYFRSSCSLFLSV